MIIQEPEGGRYQWTKEREYVNLFRLYLEAETDKEIHQLWQEVNEFTQGHKLNTQITNQLMGA